MHSLTRCLVRPYLMNLSGRYNNRIQNVYWLDSNSRSLQHALTNTFHGAFCRRPCVAELYHANSEACSGLLHQALQVVGVTNEQPIQLAPDVPPVRYVMRSLTALNLRPTTTYCITCVGCIHILNSNAYNWGTQRRTSCCVKLHPATSRAIIGLLSEVHCMAHCTSCQF